MKKDIYLDKAVAWAQKKSMDTVKSIAEGYEKPNSFESTDNDKSVQPDITFITQGGAKHYTEIALKSEDSRSLVTKWKLLSVMAAMKKGKLHLLAPKGHKMFTQKLIDQYNINALVHSI